VREIINDPAVDVTWAPRDIRPAGTSSLDTEAFRVIESTISRHYDATTLPTMSTGATDMAYLRAKGIQCYGIGPAIDIEDGPQGNGPGTMNSVGQRYRYFALRGAFKLHHRAITRLVHRAV